ncbi:MAG: hypothetical protein EHM36_02735 [Deltaproteobacteria bacterium]|nr:MAG: hypothetical protein EHM36_02735 [Deltaproteobacteria bacterium]
MLNLEVKTKLTQQEVVDRLKRFFGKGGLGLDLTDEGPQCLSFEGGGGHVTATLCPEEDLGKGPGKGKIRINLVTQEWDHQVKEFASGLP